MVKGPKQPRNKAESSYDIKAVGEGAGHFLGRLSNFDKKAC
jgi:hypothetical protein